jgi:membrane associated rhomboid family serine protease
MLIPYGVDRPARRPPYYTYGLIAVNTFLFLVTVFIANFNLAFDHVEGEKAIDAVLASDPLRVRATVKEILRRQGDDIPSSARDGDIDRFVADLSQANRRQLATQIVYAQDSNAATYRQLWQISHVQDSVVLEPHYSVLNVFAYNAAAPSLLGLLGSMFLHGGFAHLIGNMLYLWVFGRALEETLGPLIYAGAYVLCGVAATLLYHIITVQFTPHSAGLPLMGASGAIAGVLGLFATRFYRTPVRIAYVLPNTLAVVFGLAALAGAAGWFLLGWPGSAIGFLLVCAAFFVYARKWGFGTFAIASAWAIGGWLLVFNVFPGIATLFSTEKAGGTAYWAHIGGFLFGMLYATLIGSKEEGAREYLLEDAQKAFDRGEMENTICRAENLLAREPNNGGAYEILAKAHDQRGRSDAALNNYELAINKYLQSGQRDAAVRAYLHALRKNPGFILPSATQYVLGSHMAKGLDYQNAAETLIKIPDAFPDAPENELSLLRAAQIYLQNLNQAEKASQLLQTLLERYPHTQWMAQVQRGLDMAHSRMSRQLN